MQNSYGRMVLVRGLTVLVQKAQRNLLSVITQLTQDSIYAKFSARSGDTQLLLPHRVRVSLRSKKPEQSSIESN